MPSVARKPFRFAAFGASVTCFILAILAWAWGGPNGTFAGLTCVAMGFIMLAIHSTGVWPPKRGPGKVA